MSVNVFCIQSDTTKSLQDQVRFLEQAFKEASEKDCRLVVLPELFNTPFLADFIEKHKTESHKLAETIENLCHRYDLYCLAGTLAIEKDSSLYNKALLIGPDGILADYDKIHQLLFRAAKTFDESLIFEAGDHLLRFEIDGVRFGVVVCFDIRYPELARLYGESIDCLLVPAAFNQKVGKKHWKPLLQARAIENQVYLIGLNPAAHNFEGYSSYGHSMAIDPDGPILYEAGQDPEQFCVNVDPQRVLSVRGRSPYHKRKREDLYSKLEKQADWKSED